MPDARPDVKHPDLSGGNLPSVEQDQAKIGLQDQQHRHQLQRRAANVAIWLPITMFIVAAYFAWRVLRAFLKGQVELDWHVTLFVAAFVVPPTIILMAFTRAAYDAKHERTDSAPVLKFIKEVIDAVKDAVKAVKGGD